MSNPKDWSEVAAEAVFSPLISPPSKQSCMQQPINQPVIKMAADAIRTALAGYAVVPKPEYDGLAAACRAVVDSFDHSQNELRRAGVKVNRGAEPVYVEQCRKALAAPSPRG